MQHIKAGSVAEAFVVSRLTQTSGPSPLTLKRKAVRSRADELCDSETLGCTVELKYRSWTSEGAVSLRDRLHNSFIGGLDSSRDAGTQETSVNYPAIDWRRESPLQLL